MNGRTRLSAALLLTTVLGSATGCGQEATEPAKDEAAALQVASDAAMDDVPGFGRSPEAALRDQTIALYEAWRRDLVVVKCMNEARFSWQPEVLFPEEDVREIAASLQIQPSSRAKVSSAKRNLRYENRMTVKERRAYLRALYGEPLGAVDRWRATGEVPNGRDPETFATTGCSQDGWEELPGIWDFRDRVDEDWSHLTESVEATAAFRAKVPEYTDCLAGYGFADVRSPEGLERAFIEAAGSPEEEVRYREADVECNEHWLTAREAGLREFEVGFRDQHPEIDEAISRYSTVMEDLKQDDEFRFFLSRRLAELEGA